MVSIVVGTGLQLPGYRELTDHLGTPIFPLICKTRLINMGFGSVSLQDDKKANVHMREPPWACSGRLAV